jgi:hypothetical protein
MVIDRRTPGGECFLFRFRFGLFAQLLVMDVPPGLFYYNCPTLPHESILVRAYIIYLSFLTNNGSTELNVCMYVHCFFSLLAFCNLPHCLLKTARKLSGKLIEISRPTVCITVLVNFVFLL